MSVDTQNSLCVVVLTTVNFKAYFQNNLTKAVDLFSSKVVHTFLLQFREIAMITSEVYGTALRLMQHIENLLMQSVENQRTRNLLSILIEQLRNEILIRIHTFKNRIDMQRIKRKELAGHESEREAITSNYNRIRQRCGSIDRRTKTSPNIDKLEPKLEKLTIKPTKTAEIIETGNHTKFDEFDDELELKQRKLAANEHMNAIKQILNSRQSISAIVEKMGATKNDTG